MTKIALLKKIIIKNIKVFYFVTDKLFISKNIEHIFQYVVDLKNHIKGDKNGTSN
jgi:hypothetical protein